MREKRRIETTKLIPFWHINKESAKDIELITAPHSSISSDVSSIVKKGNELFCRLWLDSFVNCGPFLGIACTQWEKNRNKVAFTFLQSIVNVTLLRLLSRCVHAIPKMDYNPFFLSLQITAGLFILSRISIKVCIL